MPITGIGRCCAEAITGHAAATPTSAMNFRRLMSASTLRRWHGNGSNDCFDSVWKRLRYCKMTRWPMSVCDALGKALISPDTARRELFHHALTSSDHKILSQRGRIRSVVPPRNNRRGQHAVPVLDADDCDVRPVAGRRGGCAVAFSHTQR
jgi:hypothetical protein